MFLMPINPYIQVISRGEHFMSFFFLFIVGSYLHLTRYVFSHVHQTLPFLLCFFQVIGNLLLCVHVYERMGTSTFIDNLYRLLEEGSKKLEKIIMMERFII